VMGGPATMQDVRTDPRFPAASIPAISSVKLSPGDAVKLINISASGMLVEGRTRFVPSTRLTVTFDGGFAPSQVRGRVVRCQVASIFDGQLQYQSGIVFDTRVNLAPEGGAGEATSTPTRELLSEIRNRW